MALGWCVYCRGVIPAEAGTCQHCRKSLTPRSRVVRCDACNGFVLQSELTCRHCGKRLPSIVERNQADAKAKTALPANSGNKPTVRCPKCGSAEVTMMRKGFSLGKATVGVLALGPVGAIAGLASDQYVRVCMQCKNTF